MRALPAAAALRADLRAWLASRHHTAECCCLGCLGDADGRAADPQRRARMAEGGEPAPGGGRRAAQRRARGEPRQRRGGGAPWWGSGAQPRLISTQYENNQQAYESSPDPKIDSSIEGSRWAEVRALLRPAAYPQVLMGARQHRRAIAVNLYREAERLPFEIAEKIRKRAWRHGAVREPDPHRPVQRVREACIRYR